MIKSPKNLKIIIPLIMTLLSLTTVIAAYLVQMGRFDNDYLVGEVDIEIEAFYEKDGVKQIIDIDQDEDGIIELNISDPTQLEHFNNFRVNIIINSSAYTYFRVAVFEQFTLTYMIGDQKMVVAVAKEDFSKFAYQEGFYDNRQRDGFFYFTEKVKRNDDDSPYVIEFIGTLPEEDYHPIYESKYTLQIGFLIDAVQFIDGPRLNWGLENPPWDKNAEW